MEGWGLAGQYAAAWRLALYHSTRERGGNVPKATKEGRTSRRGRPARSNAVCRKRRSREGGTGNGRGTMASGSVFWMPILPI